MKKKSFYSTGLRPTPVDKRDFPFVALGGVVDLSKLPKEFVTSEPIAIKDQGETDMCTAYALSAVLEDHEGVLLDPGSIFYRTKQLQGDPNSWGADLRSACKAATKYGLLERSQTTFKDVPTQEERDRVVLGGYTFPGSQTKEEIHKQKSYFSVKGPFDMYDNIRSAIWQMRSEKRSVFTGALWRADWTNAKGGIIDKIGNSEGFGHAIKSYGWDNEHLVLQLSNSDKIGNKGIFLINRDAVNDAFRYDGFTFLDMPKEMAEYEVKKAASTNAFQTFGIKFSYWFKSIFA